MNPNEGLDHQASLSGKITEAHLDRLAVIYVRQSTTQQVLDHGESTRLQYGLKDDAQRMGWSADRVLIIDDDLGISGAGSEGREGFKRLVSEVSLDHVGIILGVEMSRLARSSKDWHQLLEICALFGTLIADLDGVYDASQYNDRLLLGLKGTMSEAELHLIKQRLNGGKLTKARRGELVFSVPTGYLKKSSGEVMLDPDEQVRHVVRLVFRKFEELRTLRGVLHYLVDHGVRLGIREHRKVGKGELSWHPPNRQTLHNMLRNPIYAGAYAYGRRRVDPRKQKPGKRDVGRVALARQQWPVLLKDRFPAYISWQQYERNLAQLESNRSRAEAMGSVRNGEGLLAGLAVCGKCGWKMSVWYSATEGRYTYACRQQSIHYGGRTCQYVHGPLLDEYVSRWVLKALEPAALELSLAAANNIQKERDDLNKLWQQRRERAAYEAARVERQYHLVEPENRLVARRLEREWEEKLDGQQKLEEEYDRFVHSQPRMLSEEEIQAIRRLAADIPALWEAQSTTAADRKEIIRQVVERVVVDAEGATERVKARIEWSGGGATEEELIRPVARYEQLSYWPQLRERMRELTGERLTAEAIAGHLNSEGYRPPRCSMTFRVSTVRKLRLKLGMGGKRFSRESSEELGEQEWWLADLAHTVGMPKASLYSWMQRSWVNSRKSRRGRWIVWADQAEIERLRELHRRPAGYYARQKWTQGDQSLAPTNEEEEYAGER
jgi:DNA invertase Pin-like site-specific DNA recombinase